MKFNLEKFSSDENKIFLRQWEDNGVPSSLLQNGTLLKIFSACGARNVPFNPIFSNHFQKFTFVGAFCTEKYVTEWPKSQTHAPPLFWSVTPTIRGLINIVVDAISDGYQGVLGGAQHPQKFSKIHT